MTNDPNSDPFDADDEHGDDTDYEPEREYESRLRGAPTATERTPGAIERGSS
jgi:hypothetical protein